MARPKKRKYTPSARVHAVAKGVGTKGRPKSLPKEMANGLIAAAIETVLSDNLWNRPEFIAILPVDFIYPKGFPLGVLVEQDETTMTRRIRGKEMLDWLNEKGYTTISVMDVRRAKVRMTRMMGEIDDEFLDVEQENDYNEDTGKED